MSRMKVTVRLFAVLRRYLPPGSDGRSFRMEVEDGATVRALIERMGIPDNLPRIVMVNSLRVTMTRPLKDGDTVSLFPAVGGGGERVSVIIPARNSAGKLGRNLRSLARQTVEPFEVIVVDDKSRDGTVEEASRYADTVLRAGVRGGPARARNMGLRSATGDIIAFTDSDCVVAPDWVEKILENFSRNDADALVGRTAVPPSTFLGDCISSLGFPAGGGLGFESVWPVYDDGYTVTLSTCNCALRRESFGRFGVFDEDFPTAAGEDTVFAHNLRELGGRIRFCPDMEVEHSPMTSMATFVRRQYERGIGNYFIKRKLGRVMPLIRLRFWSTKNMILKRLKDPGLPVMLCLLFAAFFLQQLGFLRARFRYSARPGVGPGSGPRKKKEVA